MKTYRTPQRDVGADAAPAGAVVDDLQPEGNAARQEELQGGVNGGPGWILGPESRERFLSDPGPDPAAMDAGVDWMDFGDGEDAVGALFLTGVGPDGERDESAVDAGDVIQKNLADCYVMSLVTSVAGVSPRYVEEMIEVQAPGQYRVRFFEKDESGGFRPVWVAVDGDLPYDTANDRPLYGMSDDVVDGVRETWPSILEKAYAKFEEGMRTRTTLATGEERVLDGYEAISFGSPRAAYEAVMGREASAATLHGQDQLGVLAERVASGSPVTAAVRGKNHMVAVTAVDVASGEVTVVNQNKPTDHPERELTLPYDEFLRWYNGVVY